MINQIIRRNKLTVLIWLSMVFLLPGVAFGMEKAKSPQLQIQELSLSTLKIPIDLGYVNSMNSNRAIGEATLAHHDILTRSYLAFGDHDVFKDTVLTLPWKSLFVFFNATTGNFGRFILRPYYQFGKGSRGLAAGAYPTYRAIYSYRTGDKGFLLESYFDLVLASYLDNIKMYGAETILTGGYQLPSDITTAEWDMVVAAGGVNNQMYFSELLADRLYEDGSGYVTDHLSYMEGRLGIYHYASAELRGGLEIGGGDLQSVVDYYDTQGYGIGLKSLQQYNLIAYGLSGSTWSYGLGMFNYLVHDQAEVYPFEIANVRVPDVAMYLNKKGISYKAKTAYRIDEASYVPFHYERILKGAFQEEWGVGFVQKLSTNTLRVNFVWGQQLEATIASAFDFRENQEIEVGASLYDVRNLNGARMIPYLNKGHTDVTGWVAWKLLL